MASAEKKKTKTVNPFKKLTLWVSGSIKRKLTFFVILVCFLMISLVWSLGIMLLEPAYDATIRKDLRRRLEVVAQTFDYAYENGIPAGEIYMTLKGTEERLSPEMQDLLQNNINKGILNFDNLCLDIANKKLLYVACIENLPSSCILHPQTSIFIPQLNYNNLNVQNVRQTVFEADGAYIEVQSQNQLIIGRSAAGGQYAVTASVNMESVSQSVDVLLRLMFPVSLSIIAISILAASIFSHWFTKPISRLSYAAREMAKGNYDVSVQVWGHDEITGLADDFNTMAVEVKRSAELQRDLIANVSHDLRTPLTLIKGYAETIRDLSGDDPVKRNEQLTVIMDETDRLSSLVGSVMEMTRISSGHEMNDPVVFDLSQLCEELSYRYEMICQKEGYTFEFYQEEELNVLADPALIERALINFLGNGLNHIGEDKYLALKIYRVRENYARVEVIDHGEGVDEADLPHLFDKYYRSRKDSGKTGTGLGLSIAKAIFETHDFKYGIISKLGEGSIFWFEAELYNNAKRK